MAPLAKLTRVAHSTFVWGASFTVMSGVVVFGGGLAPFIPFKHTHTRIGGPGMGACLKIAAQDVDIYYHPDFDPERRGVYCQNHVNLMDAHAACAAIPHAFCGMMNAWQFKIPVYGWIMTLADGIPVPKQASGRYEAVAQAARDRADKGISILTFPEAHRTLDGGVRPFKRGVFFMARSAGLPVIPLATHGMFHLMRKGSFLINPAPVKIFVGPQIDTVGLDDDQIGELADRMHAVVSAFSDTGEVPEEALARLQALPGEARRAGDAPTA
ncbi:MAG: lysophospholipid acyltransferase family protein [Nannocystaceae bacterium]|nr:1-acyl-sn-glycerol-3-phosphate acyltransferase [Myxococcales bacterium]